MHYALDLGSDKDEALRKSHRLSLGFELPEEPPKLPVKILSVKEVPVPRVVHTRPRCGRHICGP
jgi:hypothetical protein